MSDSLDFCSFCGKSKPEISELIVGPLVTICDECVALCVEILEERKTDRVEKTVTKAV